jgi:hypothetical protein
MAHSSSSNEEKPVSRPAGTRVASPGFQPWVWDDHELLQLSDGGQAKLRSETQTTVLAPDAAQAQKHESRPARPKKSYALLFHAFSRRLRCELYDAYHLFLAAFRDASEKLRSGDRIARFRQGAFHLVYPS